MFPLAKMLQSPELLDADAPAAAAVAARPMARALPGGVACPDALASVAAPEIAVWSGLALLLLALGIAADPWLCAAWSVVLFAGLHNWTELRYALRRAPARAGRLSGFIALAAGGVVLLGGLNVALSVLSAEGRLPSESATYALSTWESCVVLWALALAASRARLPPRRDWYFIHPCGCVLIALAWLAPAAWSMGLVFAHPLLALVMLDRELRRQHSPWHRTFRRTLKLVPAALGLALLAAIVWHDLPEEAIQLPGDGRPDSAGLWPRDWSAATLAAYAFLELLHYGAWILAIPAASRSGWRLSGKQLPLARRSAFCRRALTAWLCLAALILGGLWWSFAWDYAWTWTWYFRLAIFHVLLEIPLLLRSL